MHNSNEKLRIGKSILAVALWLTMVASAFGADAGNCGFNEGDPDAGKRIYRYSCLSCHGSNGKGAIPGAPDFNKKGGVLSKPHSALTDHIANGFRSPGSPMAMPPMGGNPNLTEKDMLDVHAYLHQRFGCG